MRQKMTLHTASTVSRHDRLSRRGHIMFLVIGLAVPYPNLLSAEPIALRDVQASTVARLEPWSRIEVSLLREPGQSPPRPPVTMSDFLAALERERPKAIAEAGGARPYAMRMSLQELSTFKGFVYEQSLVRRWNAKLRTPVFKLATVGHDYIDIIQVDPATGKTVRSHQAYGGHNPRTAIQKWLVSDRAANKFVLPSDVYDSIKRTVAEVEAIWKEIDNGRLDRTTGVRQIKRRAAKVGLRFDSTTDELFASSNKYGRGVLGRVGTNETTLKIKTLARDTLNSERIELNAIKNRIRVDPRLRPLWKLMGGDRKATWAMKSLFKDRFNTAKRTAPSQAGAAKTATHSLKWRSSRVVNQTRPEVQNALLSGVPPEEVTAAFQSVVKKGGTSVQMSDAINKRLSQMARKAKFSQVTRAHGVLGAFVLVGAVFDYASSEQGFEGWVKSDRPFENGARLGIGALALNAANAAERRFLKHASEQGANEAAERLGARLTSKLVSGGVVGAIFVTGESLVAVLFHDSTWSEALDRGAEAAVVIAVAEGSVVVAELIFVGEVGAFGGPVGTAIAVGATALYEAGRYAVVSWYDRETENQLFAAKCQGTRAIVKEWCKSAVARNRTAANRGG